MMNHKIILFPSNWLYNAGVMGLIFTYPEYFTFNNGSVELDINLFNNIDYESFYFKNGVVINLIGKNQYYPNYIDTKGNQKDIFIEYVTAFTGLEHSGFCNICSNPHYINPNRYSELESRGKAAEKFLSKLKKFDMVYNKLLGPSKSEFPNGFWNLNESLEICHLCSFILIHHHLVYVKLSDNSQIFINAPSFKLMFELNQIVKAIYGSGTIDNQNSKREILATSIIEYARKVNTFLGKWISMNIEIVVKSKDNIDFFSLPFDVINIISDRYIANLLGEIGETEILKLILDRKFSELIDWAYKILRISIKKPENISKNDKDFLKNLIKLKRNQLNSQEFANKLLKLYSHIEDKLKGAIV